MLQIPLLSGADSMNEHNLPTKRIFICGSALQGQPGHQNLKFIRFVGAAKTQPIYRLHSVQDGWHPGIYEVKENGISIPGEIYEQSQTQFDELCADEPPFMYPSDIVLDTGEVLTAFFYPREKVEEYQWPDISHYGGWAAYKAATSQA